MTAIANATLAFNNSTVTAITVLKQQGDNYQNAQSGFFMTVAAAYFFLGAEETRDAIKAQWADSTDAARQYATKIVRMLKTAIAAHGVDKVKEITGYATLNALVPKKATDESTKPAADTNTDTNTAPDNTPEEIISAHTPAADIANALQAYDDLVAAIMQAKSIKAVQQLDFAAIRALLA